MQEFQKTLEEIFRDFHRHPETAKEEYRTTQKVREFLEKQGIQILDLPLPTGMTSIPLRSSVLLRFSKSGKQN